MVYQEEGKNNFVVLELRSYISPVTANFRFLQCLSIADRFFTLLDLFSSTLATHLNVLSHGSILLANCAVGRLDPPQHIDGANLDFAF